MPVEEAPAGGKTTGVWKYFLLVLVFIAVSALSYSYFEGRSLSSVEVYGVKVVSDGPLDGYLDVIRSRGVALLETNSEGGLTCNFELLATLRQNHGGYKVGVEEGGQGVYLYEGGGLVRGMSEREIVTACNAFACLAGGITCPDDVKKLGGVFSGVDEVNVVLDSTAGQNGGRAYAELMGVLGYMQAERADVNKDGVLSELEVYNLSGSFLAIRPYVMEDGLCWPKALHNLVERFEPDENASVDCDMENAIFVLNSSVNSIVINNSVIYLLGDEDHIYQESIIMRDALSPRWVRELWRPRGGG